MTKLPDKDEVSGSNPLGPTTPKTTEYREKTANLDGFGRAPTECQNAGNRHRTKARRGVVSGVVNPSRSGAGRRWLRGQMPTSDEAGLLAEVRREVANAVGIDVKFTDAETIRARYAELMEAKERRAA